MGAPDTSAPSPWAAIEAKDQETLSRELGAETAGSAFLVWYRLCLASAKVRAPEVSVSCRVLAYDTGLSRSTVHLRVADLERLGFVAVERPRSDEAGSLRAVYTLLRGRSTIPENGTTPPLSDSRTPLSDSRTRVSDSLRRSVGHHPNNPNNSPLPPKGDSSEPRNGTELEPGVRRIPQADLW